MKKGGFSIIECMIYCMILAVLFVVLYNSLVASYVGFAKVSKDTTVESDLFAACDLLVKDLRQAPSDIKQWKTISQTMLIWHTDTVDIGWTVYKQKLVRITGTYNPEKQIWHKKKSSVAALNIDYINFTANTLSNQIVTDIIFKFGNSAHSINTQTALRNRVLHD